MELKHKGVLDEISLKKELAPELIEKLKKILEEFTNNFKVSIK
jgi:hypothetical protein